MILRIAKDNQINKKDIPELFSLFENKKKLYFLLSDQNPVEIYKGWIIKMQAYQTTEGNIRHEIIINTMSDSPPFNVLGNFSMGNCFICETRKELISLIDITNT